MGFGAWKEMDQTAQTSNFRELKYEEIWIWMNMEDDGICFDLVDKIEKQTWKFSDTNEILLGVQPSG